MKKILSLITMCCLVFGAEAQQPQGQSKDGMPDAETLAQYQQLLANIPDMPTDEAYTSVECHIKSQGKDLYGVRITPKDKPGKKPAVIMSHGYNGFPFVFFQLCDQLAKKGFICYYFDFAGGSMRTRSEGATTDMSLLTEKQNLTDVLDAVRSWEDVDPSRVFLIGESQGGIVSALTAAANASKVKALGLMYPAFNIPDNCKNFPSIDAIPETMQMMGLTLGRRYYADIYTLDVWKEIAGYQGDVLIVHGDKDMLVPIEVSRKALTVYSHAELKVIPEAPHGFFAPELQQINADYYCDFFCREAGL